MSDKKKTEKPDYYDLLKCKDIRQDAVEFYNTINDLYNWEEGMKKTEEQMKNESNIEPTEIEPIRTSKTLKYQHNQSEPKTTKKKATDTKPTSKSTTAASGTNLLDNTIKMEESKKEADKMKDLGNSRVKLRQYDEAIMCYTDAISYYNKDPIYYANRALCYLRMEKYDECIKDCNSAIELDSTYLKSYYRRMQAYESLGDIEKAFRDCKRILDVDPKNEANQCYNRLKNKLGIKEFNESSTLKQTSSGIFKSLPKDVIEIEMVDKPPHLRSKMPLRHVQITQAIDGVQKQDTKKTDKIKNEKNVKTMISSASVRNNDTNNKISLEEKYQSTTNITSVKTREVLGTLSSSSVEVIEKEGYTPPKTTAEFHATWKELSNEEKYLYFKAIEPKNLIKILGAGFNSDILSEIISILSEYYVNNNEKVDEILLNLSNHSQLSILSFFLTENDKQGLNKLIEYMKAQNNASEIIQKIKETFSI